MHIDDDTAALIRLMFDADLAASYLARIDLYLAVLPRDEHLHFLERELKDRLDENMPDSAIVRGIVARRRVRLTARDKLRRWSAA